MGTTRKHLIEVRNTITPEFLKKVEPLVTGESKNWAMDLYQPPILEAQCDSWSCGLFVMMGMEAWSMKGR